jgi:hypothetical protein
MTTTTNYKWLTSIHVQFKLPPGCKDADTALNDIYSHDLCPLDDLFNVNGDDVVRNVLSMIRTQVVETLVILLATYTSDPLFILPCLQSATFNLTWHNGSPRGKRVRDAATFRTPLDDAHKTENCAVELLIGLHHLHFDTRAEQLSYLGWSFISTTPFPPPFPTPGPTPVPTFVPPPTLLPAPPLGAPYNVFDVAALPVDVRHRYDKRDRGHVFCHSDLGKFAGGYYYHIDGNDRIILRSETLFITNAADEKNFLREPVPCIDGPISGIRKCYHQFTLHAIGHGFLCPPFLEESREWRSGFTCGAGTGDDLPDRWTLDLFRMASKVYILLLKCKFRDNTVYPNLVSLSNGDGCFGPKNINVHSHPANHPQPGTLAKNYPTPNNMSIHEYFAAFKDFLQLRSYTQETSTSPSIMIMNWIFFLAPLNLLTLSTMSLLTSANHALSASNMPAHMLWKPSR